MKWNKLVCLLGHRERTFLHHCLFRRSCCLFVHLCLFSLNACYVHLLMNNCGSWLRLLRLLKNFAFWLAWKFFSNNNSTSYGWHQASCHHGVHTLSHFSCVWLFWIHLDCSPAGPLSMGFSRQEYWSGLPCSPPGNLPDLGIELPDRLFTTSATWEAHHRCTSHLSTCYGKAFSCFPVWNHLPLSP